MNVILQAYRGLSASSSRSDVSDVLNSIINAPLFTFDDESRTELIKSIIRDLQHCGSRSTLTAKDAAKALLAVKTLGKDPAGSSFLATSSNLSTLLGFSTTFKDDPEAVCEALRCIANALLLIDDSRSTFIGKDVNGGDPCISMLDKATASDQIFILSRILFLSTVSGPSYLVTLVDGKYNGHTIIEILGSKLDLLTLACRGDIPFAKEGLIDTLKFSFNLLLHYPKMVDSSPQQPGAHSDQVIGELWHSKLDGLLTPLLRTFALLPTPSPSPVAAPLTHVIHALITIPINASLKPVWFGHATSTRPHEVGSPKRCSPHGSTPGSRREESPPHSSSTSPILSTLDRAISAISGGRKSSRTSSPSSNPIDVIQRAYELLNLAFAHYFPGDIDVDDASVRARAKADSGDSLDDKLSPLVVLITRFCISDENSRHRARRWLVPDDLDRTSPLEARPDMLGRCLRLLASVYHPRLKDAIGEMFFAAADSNATTLCGLVGYGNVAGFLFHKGIFSAPSAEGGSSGAPTTTADGTPINPITGVAEREKPSLPEMSDEEKEREMEKLFVLFDRLEKTGALPKEQNPIRKAIQSGKLGQ